MTSEHPSEPLGDGATAHVPEPLADAPARDIETSSSELLVRGHVWDVRRDRFAFGGVTLERDYVDHPGAVAVLALDAQDRVLLIRQYRHPIGHRDWEIPAGLMDVAGESGLAGAQRELVEEADLEAARWDVLLDICTTPGGNSEAIRIFLARELSPVEHDYVRSDEEAEMELRWEPLDVVIDAALRGDVQNAVTTNAVLAAAAAQARGWRTLRDARSPWLRRDLVRGERSRA